jgi:hypothetical protein
MSFSIAATINRWLAPQHELSCSWFLWRRLTARLRERGRGESRESGAFLLGHVEPSGAARISYFVLYDDLDPKSLNTGIVRFDGKYFGRLWAMCRERGLTVVADVHVHPGDSGQSNSDQAYPMVSQAGHIALILPRFARKPIPHDDIGIYRYLGGGEWHTVPRVRRRTFFNIGF